MNAELVKTFHFEAAHSLPNTPAGHKCSRMHGHSYRVDIHIAGPVDPQTGWVVDFGAIKQAVEPIIAGLDHRCLNEIPGLENSTSELICKYLWDRLAGALKCLSAITVWESPTAQCTYRGG